ncbi:MAG TPA: methyltransferase domain-containing protein [bacterium]|nr:methyltransferase domain-containing protein [bacterium]
MASPGDRWNPAQYDRFKAERSQPFFDLLALVEPNPGMRAIDLGCGTGALTAELHRRLGARQTTGIDNSPAMLAQAADHAIPGLDFRTRDIADFAVGGEEAPVDLLFSNAALHWLPDHAGLLAQLTRHIAPGGQLAVQVPANFHHPSHTVAAEVGQEPPFHGILCAAPPPPRVLRPEEYAAILHRLGYGAQHVRLQVYGHLLEDRDQVAQWTRGTLLTGYERALGPALFPQFLECYRHRLRERLEDSRPYFFTFNRILLWGRLPG